MRTYRKRLCRKNVKKLHFLNIGHVLQKSNFSFVKGVIVVLYILDKSLRCCIYRANKC